MTAETFAPQNRKEWRNWLAENHNKRTSIWLIYYKIKSGVPSISYNEAVDEALCFGWIDSKAQSIDENSYRQQFSIRKPKSVWSRVNKEKIVRLIQEGLMAPAGFKCIENAKENGSWIILDDVENLILPDALQIALNQHPDAATYFQSLSRTNKRNILQWIALAKQPATIQNRIQETIQAALQKTVPKPFRTK